MLVCDYDYNALTPAYLKATHEKMFRRIRAAHPQLPIVLLSRQKMHPLPLFSCVGASFVEREKFALLILAG